MAPTHELTLEAILAALFGDADTWGSWFRTALYFFFFLSSLAVVLYSFPWRKLLQQKSPLLVLAPALALTALALTWRLIFIFFVDFVKREHGIDPPNLFVEAYVLVVDELPGWWWSSTLLCWVTIACPVAHAEACRRGMPSATAFAYITLAFLGAVSLAFPLLFTHLLVLPPLPPRAQAREPRRSGPPVNRWLWPMCTAAAMLSTLALPISVRRSRPVFISALALLHVVLAVPFGYQWAAEARDADSSQSGSQRETRHRGGVAPPIRRVEPAVAPLSSDELRLLARVAAILHAGATAAAALEMRAATPNEPLTLVGLAELIRGLVRAACRNVCQQSISIDAALSTLTGMLFILMTAKWRAGERAHVVACGLLTPILGPASTLAFVCAQRTESDVMRGVIPTSNVSYIKTPARPRSNKSPTSPARGSKKSKGR